MKNSKTQGDVLHYVYYLYTQAGELVYVGKSWNPERRRKEAEKRYELNLTMKLGKHFVNILEACEYEREEIRTYMPKLNKRIASSPSSFGQTFVKSKEATEKIRLSKLGKKRAKFSNEWLANLSLSHMGNTAMLGHVHSEETRRKMRLAKSYGVPRAPQNIRTKPDRKELLQSGWGHPWRLENLDEVTKQRVENY